MKRISLFIVLIMALLVAQADAAVILLNKVGTSQSRWSGLSSDVKPTPSATGYGSTFYAEDTGITYVYGSSGWVVQKTSVTGAVTSTTTITNPLPIGEEHIGEIGGNTALVSITPTITAGAYTANDCVGGIQTLTNAIRVSAGTAVLQSVTVRDLAAQNATLQILFFNASPATGTYGDADEFDLDDTDSGLCIGMVEVNASDYKSLKDNSIGMVRNIGLPLKATTGTSLYALIKTTGTPTYASTSDLKITFGLLRD